VGEKFGGEGGADAGQAGYDVAEFVTGDDVGDGLVDGGDAVGGGL
jgi:hypothetical protein